jgi:hypothetical protein
VDESGAATTTTATGRDWHIGSTTGRVVTPRPPYLCISLLVIIQRKGSIMGLELKCHAKKTEHRKLIIENIMKAITSDNTFSVIGSGHSEAQIATHLHQTILRQLENLWKVLEPDLNSKSIEKKAKASFLWEGDKNTTINNIIFMGCQHHPDYVVQIDGIRIAIELKRGETGSAVREALGQCLVYSTQFEFTCCVVVDTSKDGKCSVAYKTGDLERQLLETLWDKFNIRLSIKSIK